MSLIDIDAIKNYISAFEEFIFQNFSLISLLTGLLLLINNTLFIKRDLDKKKNVEKNKKYYALNVTGIVLLCVFLISHCVSPYLPASYKTIKPKVKTPSPVKPRIASPLRSTPIPSPSRPLPSPSRSPSPPRPSPTPASEPKKFDFFEWLKPKPKPSSEPLPKPRLPSPPRPVPLPRPSVNDVGEIETPRPTPGPAPPRGLIENIELTETGSEGERLRIAARDPDIKRQLQLARLTPEQPRQLVQPVQPVSKPLQLTNGEFSQVNPLVRPPLLQKTLPGPPLVQPKVPSGPPKVELPAASPAPKGPQYGPDGKRVFANPVLSSA